MPRTILSVGYPLTEVGPDSVGGSEQILVALDRTLVAAGHRSLVIAAEGSKLQGTHIPSPGKPPKLDDSVREWGRQVHQRLIADVLRREPVDLVHMHGLDFHAYLPPPAFPVLATLHLPGDWYPPEIFEHQHPNFRINCVSWSQYRKCPSSPHLCDPIPNGVDLNRLAPRGPKEDFVLAMGRICPEKSFHYALEAAHLAGANMILAGEIFPFDEHLEYFESQIQPRLDDRRRFIGPLRFAEKTDMLPRAKCLLVSSTVEETSSLVAMEAIASGTPVIAFRTGALPEVVEHGRTGFIVSSVEEMADALQRVASLDPAECRRCACERFSLRVMTARYLELYERMIEDHRRMPTAAYSDSFRASATDENATYRGAS